MPCNLLIIIMLSGGFSMHYKIYEIIRGGGNILVIS